MSAAILYSISLFPFRVHFARARLYLSIVLFQENYCIYLQKPKWRICKLRFQCMTHSLCLPFRFFAFFLTDEDGDEITIYNGLDFGIFKDRKISKLFITKKYIETAQEPSVAPTTAESNAFDSIRRIQHSNIICDGCDRDIYGFRYKCLECPDFDLCMNCEDKMHSHHILVRISDPDDAQICNRLKLAKRLLRHRRHDNESAPKKHYKRNGPKDIIIPACLGPFSDMSTTARQVFVPTTETNGAATANATAPTPANAAKNKKVAFEQQKSTETGRIGGKKASTTNCSNLYGSYNPFNPFGSYAGNAGADGNKYTKSPYNQNACNYGPWGDLLSTICPTFKLPTEAASTANANDNKNNDSQNNTGNGENNAAENGESRDNTGTDGRNASAPKAPCDPLLQGMNKISSIVHNFANMMDPFAAKNDLRGYHGRTMEELIKDMEAYGMPLAGSSSDLAARAAAAQANAQAAAAQAQAHAAEAQVQAQAAMAHAQANDASVTQAQAGTASTSAPSTSAAASSSAPATTSPVADDEQAPMIVDCSDDEAEIIMQENPSSNQTDSFIVEPVDSIEKEKSPTRDWTFVEVSDVEDPMDKRMTGAIPKEKSSLPESSASSQVDYAELCRLLRSTESFSAVESAAQRTAEHEAQQQKQDEEQRKQQEELQQAENRQKEEDEEKQKQDEQQRKRQQEELTRNLSTSIAFRSP